MKVSGFDQTRSRFCFPKYRRPLERRRRVDPQHPGLAAARILPVMRCGALEIETVTRLQTILLVVQRNLAIRPAKHTGTPRPHECKTRRCRRGERCGTGAAPSPCCPRPAIPCGRRGRPPALCACPANQPAARFRWIEKIKDVGLVEARQLAQRRHRSAHVRALECAEKAHRYSHRCRHLRQREPAASAQVAQAGADRVSTVGTGPQQPSRFNSCTMAGAFRPRTLRRKRARLSSFTSSGDTAGTCWRCVAAG